MLPDRLGRLLTAYIDGELDLQQRQAVLRLLDRSSEARALLRDLQNDADQLRTLPRQALGEDFSQQLVQRIANHKVQAARFSALTLRSPVPAWFGLATAAAVLMVVGLGTYFYFAAANQEHQTGSLAVRTPEQGRSSSQDRPAEPEVLNRTAPEPARAELLSRPAPEKETTPPASTAVVRAKADKPQFESDKNLLGSPSSPPTASFKDPEVNVSLVFNLREFDQEKRKQQLHEELQKRAAHHMDLRCLDATVGIERLQAACKSQGINFIIDPGARAILELRFKAETNLALYMEDVTAEEISAILQQLRSEDRKAAAKRRQFDSVAVNAMTPDDHQTLARLLGVDPTQLDAPKAKTEEGVDIRQPISATTEEQVIRFLKGQGAWRSELGKPVPNTPERKAMVLAYPGRHRPASAEVKHYLDNRKPRRPGTLQILLILRSTKG